MPQKVARAFHEKEDAIEFEPKMQLPITIGTELLIEITDLKLRFKSELIGMEGDKYLIIKMADKSVEESLKAGKLKDSVIIIRYLFKGSVYGIKVFMTHLISDPAMLAFVTYPARIEEFNVRNNPRYECILPASARLEDEEMDIVIVDISREGCRCFVRTAGMRHKERLYGLLDVDRNIDITVQLPGDDEKLRIGARVRNMNKDAERVIVGVMFDSMEQWVRNKLMSFIALSSEVKG